MANGNSPLSAADQQQLEDQIQRDLATSPATQSAKDEFCKAWPSVKAGLGILLQIVKDPVSKMVIGLVIAVGDAAHKALGCP
jgi:hypothetical protein